MRPGLPLSCQFSLNGETLFGEFNLGDEPGDFRREPGLTFSIGNRGDLTRFGVDSEPLGRVPELTEVKSVT